MPSRSSLCETVTECVMSDDLETRDDRGQDGGDALVGVDERVSDVELTTQARRASQCTDQTTVTNRQQRYRHEDTQHAVQPHVDTHQTAIIRLQRTRTLDYDRHRLAGTRNGLDSLRHSPHT